MEIKDIAVEPNFNDEWDTIIVDALKEGGLSHAKVQKAIGGSYAKAGRLIDLAIQYGYFDNKQQAKIDVKEYEDIKIKVSKLNGELYEIQKNGIVLYQIPLIPIAIWIQQPMFMGICIFGLVVTNLKKPKGQLKKLQRELNIY